MNRYFQFAICLATLLSNTDYSRAQGLPLATNSGSELGLQVSSYNYEEQYNGAFFMSNEGNKFGLVGSATHAAGNGWYGSLDARLALGEVKYTGTGTKAGNPDRLFEGRLIVGKDFEMGNHLLSPYAGLGYRWLYNDLRGVTSSGAAGYRRISGYGYLPLGLTHRFRMGAEARVSTSLEYRHLLEGKQQSFLSDSNSRFNDPVNTQKAGYGIGVSSGYETQSWSLSVFFQYWYLQDSDQSLLTISGAPAGTVMEPQNTTTEIGAQLKYRFH
jgi:hypothetical protein